MGKLSYFLLEFTGFYRRAVKFFFKREILSLAEDTKDAEEVGKRMIGIAGMENSSYNDAIQNISGWR